MRNILNLTIFKQALIFASYLLLASLPTKADSISELNIALNKLSEKSRLVAKANVQLVKTEGEGKEAEQKNGRADVVIEASELGIKVTYAPETLKQLAVEQAAFESQNNPSIKTDTLAAVNAINADYLQNMTDASQYLSRKLVRATFINEQADTLQGRPARLLIFNLRKGNLSKKEQAYVKKYEGVLKVWTSEYGTPLATHIDETYTGRAYLVVSFKVSQTENAVYSVANKRLVATRYETLNKSAGGGELGTVKIIRTLELQPLELKP